MLNEWDGREESCSCDCGFDIPKGGHLKTLTLEDITGIANLIYPVGSIYMSLNPTDPSMLFGGTWEQIENRFLLAASSTYSVGDEGGAESYNLSVSHKHTAPVGYSSSAFGAVNINGTVSTGSGKAYRTVDTDHSGTLSSNVTGLYTANATVSDTIPTMPPYLAVYVWKRVADPETENHENFYDSANELLLDASRSDFMVEVV